MNNRSWIASFFLSLVWVIGGWGGDNHVGIFVGTVVGILYLMFGIAAAKKITFPKSFTVYSLLGIILMVSYLWSTDKEAAARSVLLFAGGGIWWLAAANNANSKKFHHIIWRSCIIAGIIFTALWIAASIFGIFKTSYGYSSLVSEASGYKNHNHLGDWWMIIAGGGLGLLPLEIMMPIFSIILVSRSRSAVIGLIAAVGYWMYCRPAWVARHKWRITAVGSIVLLLVVAMSVRKTTLGGRDYFIQASAGLLLYPWGVGYGNFEQISKDPSTHWWGRGDYSLVVHNLLLEWTAGIGWFGFIGWGWLGYISWQLGKEDGYNRWRAMYWALLINFLLDTTYFIPSMWWMFMIVIGLSFASPLDQDRVPLLGVSPGRSNNKQAD